MAKRQARAAEAERARPTHAGWPAASVTMRPISTLIPYARNARVHSDEQVAQIALSIQRFGWTIPVLCAEDGTIIAGHGRVMAAQSLGIEQVPVMVAEGWSDEKRRAYTLADNRLAENATWDDATLKLEIESLQLDGVDLTELGFTTHELDVILQGWNPDANKIASVPQGAGGDGSLTATIKITCLQAQKAGVLDAVKDALEGVFDGVTIE